jgi:hypothetical protein
MYEHEVSCVLRVPAAAPVNKNWAPVPGPGKNRPRPSLPGATLLIYLYLYTYVPMLHYNEREDDARHEPPLIISTSKGPLSPSLPLVNGGIVSY